MKVLIKIFFIVLIALVLVPSDAVSQRKKDKKQDTQNEVQLSADEKMILHESRSMQSYVLVKATERDFGKFDIEINSGYTKEGHERRIGANVNEEERLQRAKESGSIVNVLTTMSRIGYQMESGYAVAVDNAIYHYYLMTNMSEPPVVGNGYDPRDQVNGNSSQRANQNRPKLSPEEIERRREARGSK